MYWLIVVVPIAIVLWLFWGLRQKYVPLYKDSHFIEVAECLGRLKAQALDQIGHELEPTEENAHQHGMATQAGLVIVYTIVPVEADYLHHISLSHQGSYIAVAAATYFTAYIAWILNLYPYDMDIHRSERGIFHSKFLLTEEQQQAFAATPISVPTREEVPGIRQQLEDYVQKMRAAMVPPT